jgi:hypothetical protein
MRAARLFGPEDDAPSTAAAKAAGLLALVQLGHADLAVALLVDVWSKHTTADPDDTPSPDASEVSTETAILVLNAALADGGAPNAQLVAAELLCRNAARLDICQSLHWPAATTGAGCRTWAPGRSSSSWTP